MTGELVEIDKGTRPKDRLCLLDPSCALQFFSFTFKSYYENNGNNNTSSYKCFKGLDPVFSVAKEYTFGPGSHIRYQLPVSVPARRTLFEVMIRTRQPDSVIASMLSRSKDEHITLQVSKALIG